MFYTFGKTRVYNLDEADNIGLVLRRVWVSTQNVVLRSKILPDCLQRHAIGMLQNIGNFTEPDTEKSVCHFSCKLLFQCFGHIITD
jgi:hypothetical protein